MATLVRNRHLRSPLRIERSAPDLAAMGKAGARMRLDELLLAHHGEDWEKLTAAEREVLPAIAAEKDPALGLTLQLRAIDVLAELRDADAAAVLTRLASAKTVDPLVTEAARRALAVIAGSAPPEPPTEAVQARFEPLRTKRVPKAAVAKSLRGLHGVPAGVWLDRERAQALAFGAQAWALVMTREGVERWEELGRAPLTLAVVVRLEGSGAPEVARVLVALRGARRVPLELRDLTGRTRWTGSSEVQGTQLRFRGTMGRPGVRGTGVVSGSLSRTGTLKLETARLPRPARKRTPIFVSRD